MKEKDALQKIGQPISYCRGGRDECANKMTRVLY